MSSKLVTEDLLNRTPDDFSIKIFLHMDKRFGAMEARFDKLDSNFDRQLKIMDGFAKQLEDFRVESAARDAKVGRHGRWISQLAAKAELTLEY